MDLGRGLRTAFSAPLLWGGALLAVAGASGAWLAWRNWDAIVAATNRSPATAALGVAGPSLVALLGLALAFASRTQRPVAAS